MTSSSVKKFQPSFRLKLGTKALICAALVIAINTALVVGAAYWTLTSDFAERARRDIDANLRTLALAFAETFKDAKVTLKDGTVNRIEIPQFPDLKDHAIVDRAVSYVGGNATLFVYDEASSQFVQCQKGERRSRRRDPACTGPSGAGPGSPRRGLSGACRPVRQVVHDLLFSGLQSGRESDRHPLCRNPDGAT
jgi:methyl-accepting chemotaxis protein